MPVKRRAPKGRQFNITDEMVALFRRAIQIADAGDDEIWEEKGGRRREYLDTSLELDRLLGLKPWEMLPLDAGPDRPSWNNMHTQSWEKARELRLALEKASGKR